MQGASYISCVVALVVAVSIASASPVRHEDHMKRQMVKLKSLGCQPQLQKMKIMDLVGPQDNLMDMQYYFPHAVVVRRCVEECSFCGNDKGTITGRCVAKSSEEKQFIVAYFDNSSPPNKHHKKIMAVEHTSCGCQE